MSFGETVGVWWCLSTQGNHLNIGVIPQGQSGVLQVTLCRGSRVTSPTYRGLRGQWTGSCWYSCLAHRSPLRALELDLSRVVWIESFRRIDGMFGASLIMNYMFISEYVLEIGCFGWFGGPATLQTHDGGLYQTPLWWSSWWVFSFGIRNYMLWTTTCTSNYMHFSWCNTQLKKTIYIHIYTLINAIAHYSSSYCTANLLFDLRLLLVWPCTVQGEISCSLTFRDAPEPGGFWSPVEPMAQKFNKNKGTYTTLGGDFFYFHPYFGEDSQFG